MQHNYQNFLEDFSDKDKTNPKTFCFFPDKTKPKSIPNTPTNGGSEYSLPSAKANLL